MKLHFEPDLDYQLQAIDAVCDLFRGQEICRTEFTVTRQALGGQEALGFAGDELGIGNELRLLEDELLKNLHAVQLRSGVAPSQELPSRDFTVEMETGTGKTYVYLRTIFELNRRYAFTKFLIVVPSVAIKEGVYKSLQMTEQHMRSLYAGVPFEYFLYDSSKLGQVRSFATSPHIQVMVVTVGAINKKDVNNLYKDSEKTGGERPIDLIRSTRPIIIVDEPQSVDGGLEGRGKEALDAMNPLCTLRYSATHVNKHHMVYRLDAVDACDRRLVKQIEVASATVEDAHNRPYVRLLSVENKRGVISARLKLDVESKGVVKRVERKVRDGMMLEMETGRAVYNDCRIGEIRVRRGGEFMELRVPGGEVFLKPGEAYGDVDGLSIQREMIRRTIREHLDKELRLRSHGVKVLSLFFVDEVARYRSYDADGNVVKGDYARAFEDEYRRFMNHPDYRALFGEADFSRPPEEVHNGYFSIDRTGGWTDTSEGNQTGRDSAERAYNLIMKEKEKLLSFETPLKFIFSHSALREGWDNPNVFQICTLRDIRTERERRQTIGRGLRLCVNQQGQRLRGFDINTLTVIATESYQEFAENLQKEIEDDTGIKFGIVERHQFAAIAVSGPDGMAAPLGFDHSSEIWEHLRGNGYIDPSGKISDDLRVALRDGTLSLPEPFQDQLPEVREILRKLAGRLEIKNADERRSVRPREAVLQSQEFKELWDRIKHKTTYRVQFDNAKLIERCIDALNDAPAIPASRLLWRKAGIEIMKGGVEATERSGAATVMLDEQNIDLPDVLTELQDRTQLTRRTIVEVLRRSDRLNDFKRNPQAFIETASEAINRCKRLAIVDGIRYQRLGDDDYYAQELFEKEELAGYLRNMKTETKKSVYEHVVYDSATERTFADDLEKNDAVKVYAKLPVWFTIQTPLGSYNPDWAVLIETDGAERLYFVVETKSSLFGDDLREVERSKIACAKSHFKAIAVGEEPARYITSDSVEEMLGRG
jgi:type III restriction enzyme